MYVLDEALTDRGLTMADIRVALQGFGNVGSHAARLIAERGGRIVAVGDHMRGVANKEGLDVAALADWVGEHRTVKGFAGGEAFDSREVISWDADVLIPAALEDVITAENAKDVRAQIVVEAANGPTTSNSSAGSSITSSVSSRRRCAAPMPRSARLPKRKPSI
jgi:glutamate dehydrogenase/leucine dehydrogenase